MEAPPRSVPWSSRRLRSRAEFQRVFRHGVRLDGALFLMVATPSEASGRLGMAAGRRVGRAVARNRARRLLREAYRRQDPVTTSAYDLVFVVKPELTQSGLSEVQDELGRRLVRLGEAQRRRRRPRAAVRD